MDERASGPTTRNYSLPVYGVGAGAVDPAGAGEGASVEPCVFGGFLFADFFEAGVGDGLLTAALVVLAPVVPERSHDARNAVTIRIAIRETRCFFIRLILLRAAQNLWCLKPNELLGMLAVPSSS